MNDIFLMITIMNLILCAVVFTCTKRIHRRRMIWMKAQNEYWKGSDEFYKNSKIND